jgi:polyhydroxyalkanoate synthesis regulator phasin
MSFLTSAFKKLAQGEFICPQRFPDEYDALSNEQGQKAAEEWLAAIGYRLARLSDEGAFFMAHSTVTAEMRAQLREEMRVIRKELHPYIAILEAIRQSQGRDPRVHAGDMLYVSEIAEEARKSTMLENRIQEMRDISHAKLDDKTPQRIQRMLQELENAGYLDQTQEASGGYRITGKIDYLYQMIALITANAPQLAEAESDRAEGSQIRLDSKQAEEGT